MPILWTKKQTQRVQAIWRLVAMSMSSEALCSMGGLL